MPEIGQATSQPQALATTASMAGRRIVVTRAESQSGELIALLRTEGADVVSLPVITIVPGTDDGPLLRALEAIDSIDWIVFTSANAVNAFAPQLASMPTDKCPRIAAVGAATARAVTAAGLSVTFVSGGTGVHLARCLPVKPGERVLLPQSRIALPAVRDELSNRGVEVTTVMAYDTEINRDAVLSMKTTISQPVDAVIFTSPSCVAAFLEIAIDAGIDGKLLEQTGARWISIGPTTAQALRSNGLESHGMASVPTAEALVLATRDVLHV